MLATPMAKDLGVNAPTVFAAWLDRYGIDALWFSLALGLIGFAALPALTDDGHARSSSVSRE
jgi:hypothetical protein